MENTKVTVVKVIRAGRRAEFVYDVDGKRVAREVFQSNRMLLKEGTIPDGPVIEYYRNGTVKRTIAYRNERPEAPSLTYYPTGELWEEQQFINGKLEGPSVMYRRDGTLWRQASYRGGKLHGPVIVYHGNGQIETCSNHEKGRLHGSYECYDEMGFLKEKGSFKNGKREGIWIVYDENGGTEFGTYYHGLRMEQKNVYDNTSIGEDNGSRPRPGQDSCTYHTHPFNCRSLESRR